MEHIQSNTSTTIPTKKARCYLVYALAPNGVKAKEANRVINEMSADASLPLALWHDHFIGQAGGTIIFYAETQAEQQALFENQHLQGWQVDYRPLVFSFSPSAFDAQISYTLKNYRSTDWETLRNSERPNYGNYGERDLSQEAETGIEQV